MDTPMPPSAGLGATEAARAPETFGTFPATLAARLVAKLAEPWVTAGATWVAQAFISLRASVRPFTSMRLPPAIGSGPPGHPGAPAPVPFAGGSGGARLNVLP